MGLLAKTNPTATRESVIREAIVWGAISVVAFTVYCLWTSSPPQYWPMFLPLVAIFGAGVGALMEWQLDDGVEIYWVVLEAEDEFAIKIPEWEEIDTVDDLYQAVLANLRIQYPDETDGQKINEDEVWDRLKTMLIKQMSLKPEEVVKSARFYGELGL